MKTIDFRYVYRRSHAPDLESLLSYLESELGGVRSPYDGRKGAIDLVTVLEIVLYFSIVTAIQQVLGKYFEGLFNGDGFKELGENHQKQIVAWLSEAENEIQKTIKTIEPLLTLRPSKSYNDAIALSFQFEDKTLYIVLNHQVMSRDLLSNLPEGIMATIRLFIDYPIPDDSRIYQLYFDKTTKRWKFLFAPSLVGFGRVIDRYIDLDTKELHRISSRREFVEKFRPEISDEFKFLVSPFREQDFI